MFVPSSQHQREGVLFLFFWFCFSALLRIPIQWNCFQLRRELLLDWKSALGFKIYWPQRCYTVIKTNTRELADSCREPIIWGGFNKTLQLHGYYDQPRHQGFIKISKTREGSDKDQKKRKKTAFPGGDSLALFNNSDGDAIDPQSRSECWGENLPTLRLDELYKAD